MDGWMVTQMAQTKYVDVRFQTTKYYVNLYILIFSVHVFGPSFYNFLRWIWV